MEILTLIKFAELVLPALERLGDNYASAQSIARRLAAGEELNIEEAKAAFDLLAEADDRIQNLD